MRTLNTILTALLILGSIGLFAQVPEAFNYQAVARDGSGNPLENTSLTVVIGIYSGPGGATLEYEETHTTSTNDFGLFSLRIGTGTVNTGNFTSIAWGANDFYLQVQVDDGTGMVNLGKTQLVSVPYAMHARTVEDAIWGRNGSNIFYNNGMVGIGTNSPNWKFHIYALSGAAYMLVSDATDGPNTGLRIGMSGAGNAYILNDNNGKDLNLGTNGTRDVTLNSNGMLGVGTNTPMLRLHVRSVNHTGILGANIGSIYSESQTISPAIYGQSAGSSANLAYGVYGQSYSTNNSYNIGVFGEGGGGTSNNYGVYAADYGESGSNYSIAIYADQEGTGGAGEYAGYFSGDVQITGTLSKAGGSFKIDHPLEPAQKYLYHSFVESPDMMNVYNGNITTDANGMALVKLPDYFQALNMNFRYQLTVIGTFANAIVLQEIKNNQFVIKTDQPNVKVSWQVTGIRHDKWAQQNRIIPEVEKQGVELGRYLHPEMYSGPEGEKVEGLPVGIK